MEIYLMIFTVHMITFSLGVIVGYLSKDTIDDLRRYKR